MPRHDVTGKIDSNPNWQPGDVAICVRGGPVTTILHTPPKGGYPEKGRFYTVERVFDDYQFVDGRHVALEFIDAPENVGGRVWSAARFVKVTPPENMENDLEIVDISEKEPV